MKWRFINTGVSTGAMNMAIDEAVMVHCANGDSPPTLRFYRWEPATLTLGYFQKADRDVDFEGCARLGIDVVRRLTGGRAVLHDQELTYSVILAREGSPLPESVSKSYRILSQGLLVGFDLLDIPVTFSKPPARGAKLGSSAACFDALSSYELEAQGKKIVGSAQARRFGAILQHGSILNDLSVDRLFATMKDSDFQRLARARESFLQKATSIRHVTGSTRPWEQLVDAFREGFRQGLCVDFEETDLSPSEWAMARQLEQEKYSTDDWNLRR